MYKGREDEEEDLSSNKTRPGFSCLSLTHGTGSPEFKSDIRIPNSYSGLLYFDISLDLVKHFHLQISDTDMYK
jgi:hypothetical protein